MPSSRSRESTSRGSKSPDIAPLSMVVVHRGRPTATNRLCEVEGGAAIRDRTLSVRLGFKVLVRIDHSNHAPNRTSTAERSFRTSGDDGIVVGWQQDCSILCARRSAHGTTAGGPKKPMYTGSVNTS